MGGNGRVYKVDPDGKLVKTYKKPYPAAPTAQFKSIAAAKDGTAMWLAVRDRGVVARFDHSLRFKAKMRAEGDEAVQFRQPNGLFADDLGNLYVSDKEQNKVYVFNADGATLHIIDHGSDSMDTLNGPGPYTVFAPSDEAFKAVPAKTMEGLKKDPEQLKAVLLYHVVPGKVASADLPDGKTKTAQGADLAVARTAGLVTVDDALVTQADVPASNGVVHVIDRVLIPPKR